MRDPRSTFADFAHDEVVRLQDEIERLRAALQMVKRRVLAKIEDPSADLLHVVMLIDSTVSGDEES